MTELVFVARGIPNLLKSAGDIRSYRMLKILRKKYNVTVIARSADYGEADVKGLGCDSYLTGNTQGTLQQVISQKNPEIIILSHWTIANEMISYIRSISSAKIWIDTIDVEFLRLSRKLPFGGIDQNEVDRVKRLELDVYSKADGLIVVSDQDCELLEENGLNNIIQLPCLFEINNQYQVNAGRNGYIICNWTHEPNILSTVYLCEKIVHKCEMMFYIVGKHPPEKIKEFNSNKIMICGAEYEITKFLMKMNVLLCPVFYGAGINGKIGESLAFGIPVVTSKLGADPYHIENRVHALVTESEEEFISCVGEIFSDEKLRKSLSENGKELMKKYTSEYWQENFLDLIEVKNG